MHITELTGSKSWTELATWYHNFPFAGQKPFPMKITRDSAYFMSEADSSDGLHRTPNPIYFSTAALTTGIFSLTPGEFFKPDNHPNPEPYIVLNGSIVVGNADTGQYLELEPGDGYVIPAFNFHVGYNFGDKTAEMLFMIPRETATEQMRADPTYDAHYQRFRSPITLHRNIEHRYQRHESWAQPGHRAGEAPRSHLDDLLCWPPHSDSAARYDPKIDHARVQNGRDWLHFVTGKDYQHQFLSSFCYSTNEFQAGKIKIPPGRVTNAISVPGERVYYPCGDGQLIIVLSGSESCLVGGQGDALFVPTNVTHQFQNPGSKSLEAYFFSATQEGVTYY